VEDAAEALPWIDLPELDVVQVPFSAFDPHSAEALIQRASERGVTVVARGVLGQGRATTAHHQSGETHGLGADLAALAAASGRSVQDLAIEFARAREGVGVVLVGVRLPSHLDDLLSGAARGALPSDVMDALQAVVAADRAG
ncbi:MAG: aldo/keto reductase, partial [Ilumatobacteraceae bacterium]